MTSIQPRFTNGPYTYEAVEAVLGGQLVEARAGGVDNPGCGLAADASKKVLGVALVDAGPTGGAPQTPQSGVLSTQLTVKEVAVQNDGVVPVTYSAACAYGARVASAGAGKVRPWVSGDGADAVVGWCRQPGGVAQDAVGFTRINV